MISIFESKTYRSFLTTWMGAQSNKGYGLRSRLADVIGTKTGFITQVFNEAADFSLEQGIQIARWIGLNEEESGFFLLLIQKDRAGTGELRQHFSKQISQVLTQRRNLSERLKAKKAPSSIDQSIYFSSWIYSYIHVLLTCQDFITLEEMARRTRLDVSLLRKVLDFLTEAKLVEETKKGFKTGEARMHLGTDSPHLLKHHLNWNLKAIQAFEADLTKGLHYSSVISLSKEDMIKAREIWTKTLEEFKELVRLSQGEAVYGFTLNLFEV